MQKTSGQKSHAPERAAKKVFFSVKQSFYKERPSMPEKLDKDKGKDELFIWLYDTYQERLRGYIYSMGVTYNLDDLVQETFLRLYYHIQKPDFSIENENIEAYLYRIARNLVYDNHRHTKRASRVKVEMDDTLLQGIADKDRLPEEIYEEKELLETLKKAIEKLPEKIAEAVRGLLEGKTFEIVAHDIGIQVPALKYRLRKAKDLLDDVC
jgi:RNA polymerase sigma-70 factor (ECF subfamily)